MEYKNKQLWDAFIRSLTWGDVLREYLAALTHIEQYRDAQPHKQLPASAVPALASLHAIHDQWRQVIQDPAYYETPALPDAANFILATVRRVKREVPTVEPMTGHAQQGNRP